MKTHNRLSDKFELRDDIACDFQVITGELPIFLREHFNGMYRTDVYFLCKSFADLPIYIIFPFIFTAIPYFAIGLNPEPAQFFTAAVIVILVANVATSFGKYARSSCLFIVFTALTRTDPY